MSDEILQDFGIKMSFSWHFRNCLVELPNKSLLSCFIERGGWLLHAPSGKWVAPWLLRDITTKTEGHRKARLPSHHSWKATTTPKRLFTRFFKGSPAASDRRTVASASEIERRTKQSKTRTTREQQLTRPCSRMCVLPKRSERTVITPSTPSRSIIASLSSPTHPSGTSLDQAF